MISFEISFTVFFAVALLTLSDDSGESYLSELHIGPDMKYYDSDGGNVSQNNHQQLVQLFTKSLNLVILK